MTNVARFWEEKRWEHIAKAHTQLFKMQEYDMYCFAAAIAYTASLCHEALATVEDRHR